MIWKTLQDSLHYKLNYLGHNRFHRLINIPIETLNFHRKILLYGRRIRWLLWTANFLFHLSEFFCDRALSRCFSYSLNKATLNMTVIAFLLCTVQDFCLRRKINTICTYFGRNLHHENSCKPLQRQKNHA